MDAGNPLARSCQRDMRPVGPIFGGNSDGLVGRRRQCGERVVGLYRRIQDSRKPVQAANHDIDRRGSLNRCERTLQFVQALLWPLADEFRGDMQLLYRDPSELGERPQAGDESRQRSSDIGRDIDRGEKSQDPLVYGKGGV